MSISSQLKIINELPLEEDRIEALRKITSKHLKELLSYTFDDNIVWLLPDIDYKYKPSTDRKDKLEPRLLQEMKSLPIFLNIGKYPHMLPSKRVGLFISILETIENGDAEMLVSIRQRKLPFENLTREVVEKAFPLLAEKWKKRP